MGYVRAAAPRDQAFFQPSFVSSRVNFFREPNAKCPGIQGAANFLKSWAKSQCWSSPSLTPSIYLLELIAVHVATRPGAGEQAEVGLRGLRMLEACADFNNLQVTWVHNAKDGYVSSEQRPVLLDPVNGFANVADPRVFDASELTLFAKRALGTA